MQIRIIAAMLLASVTASAQAADERWHWIVEPYVLFPYMQGDTGLGVLPPVAVDQDPGDIFDKLQMGAMLYAEVHNERWAFSSDVLYMDLEADVLRSSSIASGDVEVSQLGWELAVLRRISPWIELGVSAMYMDMDGEVNINVNTPAGAVNRRSKMSRDWVDPTALARVQVPLGSKWFFIGRGNIGGFGVSSQSFWQLQADLGYRFSERMLMSAGYRFIDYRYDRGSGADRFLYDMTTSGPMLRLGFTF